MYLFCSTLPYLTGNSYPSTPVPLYLLSPVFLLGISFVAFSVLDMGTRLGAWLGFFDNQNISEIIFGLGLKKNWT